MPVLYQTRRFAYSMSQSIRERKISLRKDFKDLLAKVTVEDVQKQSTTVTEKVLKLEEFRKAKSISVFLSMPNNEISTREILLAAFRDGKKVFVPFIHGIRDSKTMEMLRLLDEDDLNSLQPDAWGIPSLDKRSVANRQNALGGFGCFQEDTNRTSGDLGLDLILMPGMAFDSSHNRLGHGRGFYDRYLTALRKLSDAEQPKSNLPCLVGLALREQLLSDGETLPVTVQDWKVDLLVTADF